MATTLTINGQDYIVEKGAGGYTYYRTVQAQRFGKKVKAKNGILLVWNGTDGTPNPEQGLAGLTWGQGSTYVAP